MAENMENELLDLARGARELLLWEQSLGGGGFPEARELPQPAEGPGERLEAPPADLLRRLEREAAACTACALHTHRTQSVFSRGEAETDLVFVGEGPGYHEDQQGLPFVGRAGQLLDRMIQAMGYEREQVYICNVVKCRPPENRTPLPAEAAACARFLVPQLQAVNPKVIVALGRCAAENLRCVPPTGKWRGVWGEWHGIPVMPTYHPAFLLRSPEFKKPVWADLQVVLEKLGRSAPRR